MSLEKWIEAWEGKRMILDRQEGSHRLHQEWCQKVQEIRVQQIIENTDMQHWCYVPTRENPADGASRGLNTARVHPGNCWGQP